MAIRSVIGGLLAKAAEAFPDDQALPAGVDPAAATMGLASYGELVMDLQVSDRGVLARRALSRRCAWEASRLLGQPESLVRRQAAAPAEDLSRTKSVAA